jgi:hypothetical protein
MRLFEVDEICDAYESGMGHGLKQDGHQSPYSNAAETKAYNLGYKLGEERAKATGALTILPKGFRAVKDGYQTIFNAIGDATTVLFCGGLEISVRKFWESVDKAQPEVSVVDGQDVINVTQQP